MISHLSIKNFTAFTDLVIDFSPGIVLLGLDAFDPTTQKAVMTRFKDKLQADVGEESFEAWKRKHITDCVVLSQPQATQTNICSNFGVRLANDNA